MAAINFPSSPSNGDTHTVGGVTYTYNSAETKWKTTINSNAFLPLSGGTVSGNIVLGGELQHSGDTDTKITFGTDTIKLDTGGTTRATVDSSGRVLAGTSSSSANTRAVFAGNSAGSTGAGVVQIARGNTFTAASTNIANLEFTDSDGNIFGRIQCESDAATVAGSDHPGRISIETTADGGTTVTEAVRIDSSQNLRFNSGYGSVATAYGVRAWVNFDGRASTIGSGRANGNVSSVADNGTGQYTVNFTNSFPDNNYAVAQFCRADAGGGMRACVGRGSTGFANGSIQVEIRNGGNNLEDVDAVCLAFFR